MKTLKSVIALILCLGLLTSCDHETIRAQGEVTSTEVSFSDYSGLRVSNAFNAFVTFSDAEEKIVIEANDNLHNRIIVKRDGNDVVIKLKNFTNVKGNATLNAYITTKNMSKFEIAGASTLTLENEWISEDARIEISGASNFTGELSTDNLHLDMSGASKANFFGTVKDVYADLSGSSYLRDYNLQIEKLNIDLSGASSAFLSVSESLEIEGSGASTLKYKGDAMVNSKNLSGASEIIKKD
jgi:putative autotransporter adhesin-like protein